MKTLIYGAGPIGRWLALRLPKGNQDTTLLAFVPRHSGCVRREVA
jgi:ketopantoate reductase